MIVRIWLIGGVLLVALAWILMVPLSPEPFQGAPGGNIASYRAQGLMPEPGGFTLSDEIGHEVFEIPAADALQRGEETAMAGMEGMDMSGEKAEAAEDSMPGMAMGEMTAAEPAEAPMAGMAMSEMTAAEPGEAPMPGMAMGEMTAAEPAEVPMAGMAMGEMTAAEPAEAPMPAMAMEEMTAAEPAEAPMAGMAMAERDEGGHVGGGLTVLPVEMAGMAGRTIEIEMREWGFSPPNIAVKAGEVIHFKVRNRGSLPHEFMFMPPAGMAAVDYRLERADWNLTEHEASFERALVMPGDGFEMVVEIARPGVWMFMCMFPYHMQFGMMGMMMTEGAGMDGMNMGGMKM